MHACLVAALQVKKCVIVPLANRNSSVAVLRHPVAPSSRHPCFLDVACLQASCGSPLASVLVILAI
jgi:hypothetical protein